ncbi:LysR family transcriptional regulator [Piscinibacter sp. XHJ-5]|uniref:LysR family transcriptional regulator n=1 Tax=Piscinibacter sp. XHJ-5 TaxID=3037797 RepID=UPI0024532B62|nr:LysR family transcriptional regulator [Piscinibacter sp. XHJ-5]
MDRFEGMRVFVTVADAKGFAPAARLLGMSPPAVSRAIVALEEHVGAQLLRRTTRSVSLTEAGERFHAHCKRILAEVAEAEAVAGGTHSAPQGQLAITAPQMFGRMHVAPVLLAFLAQHPQVSARAHFVDHIVHLLEEGFDVAVRIAHLPDSGLTAIRVGHVRRVIVASPAYLEAHGEPRTPADLARHDGVGFAMHGGVVAPWALYPPGRKSRAQREIAHPRMQLVANTGEVGIAAALAGHGLARALSYQVAESVKQGRLRIVLADHEPPPIPVQVVHADGRRAAAKVRAFIDFAVERLRREPVLQNGA